MSCNTKQSAVVKEAKQSAVVKDAKQSAVVKEAHVPAHRCTRIRPHTPTHAHTQLTHAQEMVVAATKGGKSMKRV